MLPMDTKPVTGGNDVVLTSKSSHQTSPVAYLTENRSTSILSYPENVRRPLVLFLFRGAGHPQPYRKWGSITTEISHSRDKVIMQRFRTHVYITFYKQLFQNEIVFRFHIAEG